MASRAYPFIPSNEYSGFRTQMPSELPERYGWSADVERRKAMDTLRYTTPAAGERAAGHWISPPTIKELRAAGWESLRAIAAGMEGRQWSAVRVSRLLVGLMCGGVLLVTLKGGS